MLVMFRIGHGYDVHRISTEDRPLMLGGIEVSAPFSLEAHSDGDVILHAITDALLGAVALGDIGQHFKTIFNCTSATSIITPAMLASYSQLDE